MAQRCVLFISHEFPPEGGGAGRNLAYLASALNQCGWKVRIWAGQGIQRQPAAKMDSGIVFKSISTHRTKAFVTSLLLHIRFLRRCSWKNYRQTWQNENPPDWICANMAWPAGWAAKRLASRLKVPFAIWHHGSDVHGGLAQGANWPQKKVLQYLWKDCSKVFFVSESLRQTAASYGNLPPSALVPSMVNPELRAKAETQQQSLVNGKSFFLFLGRFESVKEPQIAIEAIHYARQQGVPLQLRMIGQGSLFESLQRLIEKFELQNQVTLEKEVEHHELPALFMETIALVLPSRVEGMSLTVLEAGIFSVPCLAANSPGLRDCVGGHGMGRLFPLGDSEALAEELIELQQNPKIQAQLGKQAREWAETLTPMRAAEAFAAALEEGAIEINGELQKAFSKEAA